MKAVNETDDEKARAEKMQRLEAEATPYFNRIIELCTLDGALNLERLTEHLAMHAALHVVEIALLKRQFEALNHNYQMLRTQDLMRFGAGAQKLVKNLPLDKQKPLG